MSDIFLSYAAEDRTRTRVLVEALESRGWSVWWDRTIPPGKTFDSVIERALESARCVVVLWSVASVTSDWVKTEAAEAARRGILVPALLDDVSSPLEFRRIQAARLVGWDGDLTDEEYATLVRAVAEKLGSPIEPRIEPSIEEPEPSKPRNRSRVVRLRLVVGSTLASLLGVALYLWVWYLSRPVIVGVMDFHRRGNVPEWVSEYTRSTLNTILSNVSGVHVYSREAIDLLCNKRGLSEIEAAEQLGVTKMVSGDISDTTGNLMLGVEIVDIGSRGMLEGTTRVRGTEREVAEMVNRAVITIVKSLKHGISEEQIQQLVANHTSDDIDSYRLLAESMGTAVNEERSPAPEQAPKPAPPGTSSLRWPDAAWAADPSDQAIRQLIEQYRAALESKKLDDVARLYVDMTPSIRDALTRYFATAEDLKIQFSNIDILVEGNDAVVTFTRNDDFKDTRSGKAVHLEVRISVVAKQESGWKIQGMRKPSEG